jgi:predicted ABC-type ATPase
MTPRPWVYVIAGPNGAGKTTLARQLFPDVATINPDEIARDLSADAPEEAAFAAGRRAIEIVRERLRAAESFALETTLAGRWILAVMDSARGAGFGVALVYVGVDSERLAIQRVRERRQAGGHDVPEGDVRRRYRRSLAHLPAAIGLSDHTMLYDNSAPANAGPRIFAEVEQGIVTALEPDPPRWLMRAFPSGLRISDGIRPNQGP